MRGSPECPGKGYPRIWMAKIVAPLLLLAFVSIPASSQSGCTPYHLWEVSGYAGNATTGPGGDPNWQYFIQQKELQYGGSPTCNYTWEAQTATWYGDCYAIAYNCTVAPTAPVLAP